MRTYRIHGKEYLVNEEKFIYNTRTELNTGATLKEIKEKVVVAGNLKDLLGQFTFVPVEILWQRLHLPDAVWKFMTTDLLSTRHRTQRQFSVWSMLVSVGMKEIRE